MQDGKPIKKVPSVDMSDPMQSFTSVYDVLDKYLPDKYKKEVLRVLYGGKTNPIAVPIPEKVQKVSDELNFEVKHWDLSKQALQEELFPPRIVRVGAIQNAIVTQPDSGKSLKEQRDTLFARMETLINAAGEMGVNVLGLQEAWPMPFAFCTREKHPWMQFAEDVKTGPSAVFIKALAKKWNMVIISPVLERDSEHAGTIWNTAVVWGNKGNYIGKVRKNHIPRVGDFNEANYYLEGNTGHPVFETQFGKIGINICYGRHHPLNWMMYGLNGAEIVFNPSATVGALSEPLWGIEARNAAIANTYFSVGINRVGTEFFPNEFTSGNGLKAHKDFGHFYGSSYVAGPDGARCPELSRLADGVLCCDVDLNQVRQVRDVWTYQNTARYDVYAKKLAAFVKADFKPQRVIDPSLKDNEKGQEFEQQTEAVFDYQN